jgi:hypothetical protein
MHPAVDLGSAGPLRSRIQEAVIPPILTPNLYIAVDGSDMLMFRWLLCLNLLLMTSGNLLAENPTFRTDGGDEKLPWYQVKLDEFPPAMSAHAIAGELIHVDHIKRTGTIRMDRTGSQRTDDYDQPLNFELLPYASLSNHGAPCELADIPLGTHLHGHFYEETRDGKHVFYWALRFEDDFSRLLANQRAWRVDSVDLGKQSLVVTGVHTTNNSSDPKPTTFQLSRATRVWKGREIASQKDVAAGQMVFINLTVCTLKGPGRCTDIWLDPASRDTATTTQLEVHRLYQQEHGLACQVEAVDNKEKILTVNVFGGFDPSLREHFKIHHHIAIAVANQDLRTHDQINDCARGPIVEVLEATPGPGQSGLRLRIKPDILLEGFRPKKIVRIFGGAWRVDDLPREERAYDG